MPPNFKEKQIDKRKESYQRKKLDWTFRALVKHKDSFFSLEY